VSLPRYPKYKDSGVEWLGQVPSHWGVDRIKASIASARNGIWGEEPQGDESDIVCVRVADFDRGKLQVKPSVLTVRSVTEKERAGRILERGNLLLEKSGGGELQPVGQVVRYQLDSPAICSNFVAKVVLKQGMCAGYWNYVHSTAYSVGVNLGSINQTSGIQNLDQNRYFNERAPFPPEAEQDAIAAFLDRETARIDALIDEQQKLIALLAEKRQATISHAVTKGLDPNAPKKDSGVAWLGEVPAHWEMKRVKDCGCEVVDCKNRTPEPHDDGDYFVVRTSCVKDGQFNLEPGYWTDEANFVEWTAKGRPREGDVLFTREAPTGEACLAPEGLNFCLGQRMMYMRPPKQALLSEFLLYSIYGGLARERISEKSKGSTVGHLRVGEVGELPLLLPPLDEQQALITFVGVELSKLKALSAEAGRAIALMTERRSSLIAAAVTGQIDVRGA
jgi:type I restriction enzyme S subunit